MGALLERENLRGPRPWLPLGDEVTIRGSNKLLSGVMMVVVVVVVVVMMMVVVVMMVVVKMVMMVMVIA